MGLVANLNKIAVRVAPYAEDSSENAPKLDVLFLQCLEEFFIVMAFYFYLS